MFPACMLWLLPSKVFGPYIPTPCWLEADIASVGFFGDMKLLLLGEKFVTPNSCCPFLDLSLLPAIPEEILRLGFEYW